MILGNFGCVTKKWPLGATPYSSTNPDKNTEYLFAAGGVICILIVTHYFAVCVAIRPWSGEAADKKLQFFRI